MLRRNLSEENLQEANGYSWLWIKDGFNKKIIGKVMFELCNSYSDLTYKQLLEKSAKPTKELFQADLKKILRKVFVQCSILG